MYLFVSVFVFTHVLDFVFCQYLYFHLSLCVFSYIYLFISFDVFVVLAVFALALVDVLKWLEGGTYELLCTGGIILTFDFLDFFIFSFEGLTSPSAQGGIILTLIAAPQLFCIIFLH